MNTAQDDEDKICVNRHWSGWTIGAEANRRQAEAYDVDSVAYLCMSQIRNPRNPVLTGLENKANALDNEQDSSELLRAQKVRSSLRQRHRVRSIPVQRKQIDAFFVFLFGHERSGTATRIALCHPSTSLTKST